MKTDIGLIGLGVMGKNLALNIAGKGFSLSLYNKKEHDNGDNIAREFTLANPDLSASLGFNELLPFLYSLKKPRIIILMITAGEAVDQVLSTMKSSLEAGDVIIDGGNSHYRDSMRRFNECSKEGIHFLGTGISGGWKGALKGPSIMAGGSEEAYKIAEPILSSIAAKDNPGKTCANHIGPNGAGHFVKMVHNGIEYGEMQIIAEFYSVLKHGLGLSPDKIAVVFERWCKTGHQSYLLDITIKILREKEGEEWIIDKISDKALASGTGKWCVQAACDLDIPVPTIAVALFARHHSIFKTLRQDAAQVYQVPKKKFEQDIDSLAKAYHTIRLINHQQGFHLIEAGSNAYHWGINLRQVAQTWTAGCIIQSELMGELQHILKNGNHLISSPEIMLQIKDGLPILSELVSNAAKSEIAIPAISASLNYLYNYIEDSSPANLIQAQRDYFGSHGICNEGDLPNNKYHYEWPE